MNVLFLPVISRLGRNEKRLIYVTSLLFLALVLALDSITPLGYFEGMLYVPVLFFAALSRQRRWIRSIALLAIVGVMLGIVVSEHPPIPMPLVVVVLNRLTVVVVIVLFEQLLEYFQYAQALQKCFNADLEERARLLDFACRLGQLGGWKVDLPSLAVHWSDEVCRLHGYPPGHVPTLEEGIAYYHPDDQPVIRAAFHTCADHGVPFDLDLRLIPISGDELWVRAVGQATYDPDGVVIRVHGFIQNIQASKANATALSRSLIQWHDLAESMPMTVWTANEAGQVTFVSGRLCEYSGQSAEELARLGGSQVVHPADVEQAQSRWSHCVATRRIYEVELRLLRADGVYRWHLARAVRGESQPDGSAKWYGTLVDIHDQKLLEKEASSLAKRLTSTLESITDAFIAFDSEWRYVYVNERTEQVLLRDRKDLVGRVLWEEYPEVLGTAFEIRYREAVRTQTPCRFEEFYAPMAKWFEVSAYPSDQGLAVYFRDVTEQRALAEQYKQVQRLESLGQLTGGVAHDFNNLLTVILGNAELLSEQLEGDERLRRLADMIRGAAQRSAELTQRLLAFARKQPLDPRPTDLNRLIHDLEPMLRRSLGEQVEVELVTAVNLWPTLVDPGQMESGLVNLAVNARDALPKGGRLTIETSNTVLDAAYVSQHADVAAGPYVKVAVSDTGEGIPASVLPKVFDPFFTTKEKGKGTGLGLATLYGFVKQSHGHVVIESEVGHGTTVTIYLPRLLQPVAAPSGSVGSSVHGQGHGELVLVVEDDAMVRKYATGQLESLGYRVLEAGNGAEGLAILRERQDVQLLFTDVVMPGGMSGQQLAEAALELHPSLPVLYTSGYAEDVIVHNGRLDPGVQLLSKPYRRAELAAKLKQVMEEGGKGVAASP